MFVYIYDHAKQDWIEAEDLFPHDVALLIENDQRKVYFYSGSKCKAEEREQGLQSSQDILNKFPSYSLEILSDAIPLKIQAEIDLLLGENIDASRFKEDRTISMNFLMILGLLYSLSFLLILINSFRVIGWTIENNILMPSHEVFEENFALSIIFAWITIGIGGVYALNSLITRRIFLIICAVVSEGIILGVFFYLQKGIAIFSLDSGYTDPYLIPRLQIMLFVMWMCIAWISSTAAIGINIRVILKHTVQNTKQQLSLDEMRLSAKPTILRDKTIVELKEIEE
ncbi:hypothetical protein NEF87_002464 [Candidatus Lokiarchaeum ossiferum]|uniref:Uncharacterized protein n=1 Tax=Candidatus Lokiarchaeum ossiferum TaxID=2951803 RepID=A0ABY6HRP6_9ARCH|nr:hypothetical protein NEF87_002464 [Candidatus Lokiarchaeum sp. B-35]